MAELKPCPFCGGKAQHFFCTPNGQHFWNIENAVIWGQKTSHNVIMCTKCGIRSKKKFWKHMGAYEAPEGNKLYLDLEGIRLVIDNGELNGWYEL